MKRKHEASKHTSERTANKMAIGYIRVSSNGQSEEGISLDAQQASIQAYCTMRRLELVETVCDPGVSGWTPIGEREGGRRLLDMLNAGTFRHVIALKIDRLFRNTIDCLTVVQDWERRGVGLHIIDMGGQAIDTSSAVGKMFLTMAAGFAEMERNMAAERTRLAFARRRAEGKRVSARLPYGVTVVDDHGTLAPSEADKRLMARIKRLHRAGKTIREIAEQLRAAGVTSRTGAPISKSTVDRLLRA